MSDPNIYEQLNTFNLKNVATSDIANITDKTNIMFQNEFDLERYNNINKAVFRMDNGPIPGRGKVVQTTGDSDRIQFRPEVGEVWQLVGGDILEQATGTLTVNFQLRDDDGNIAFIGSASSTGQEPITTDNLYKVFPLYLTHSLYLYADLTGGTGRISTALVQIR